MSIQPDGFDDVNKMHEVRSSQKFKNKLNDILSSGNKPTKKRKKSSISNQNKNSISNVKFIDIPPPPSNPTKSVDKPSQRKNSKAINGPQMSVPPPPPSTLPPPPLNAPKRTSLAPLPKPPKGPPKSRKRKKRKKSNLLLDNDEFKDTDKVIKHELIMTTNELQINSDITQKITIVGPARVGKTSLKKILSGDAFDESEPPTIRLSDQQKAFSALINTTIKNNVKVKYELYDTPGQSLYDIIYPFNNKMISPKKHV